MKFFLNCMALGLLLAITIAGYSRAKLWEQWWHDFFTWTLGALSLCVFYIREIRSTFQRYLDIQVDDNSASKRLKSTARIKIRKADHIVTMALVVQLCSLLILKLNERLLLFPPYALGIYALTVSIGSAIFLISAYIASHRSESQLQDDLEGYRERLAQKEESINRAKQLQSQFKGPEELARQDQIIEECEELEP